jgi:hypothetical protein
MRIVAFFDYIGYNEDAEDLKLIVTNFEAEYNKKPILKTTDNEEEFANLLMSNCLAIVDYGALNYVGSSGLKDHYDRFMQKLIEENPSIIFCFKLTMGRECYKDELFDHCNVITIDTAASLDEWNKLLLEYYN